MKRIIFAFVLVLILCMSLFSCGQESADERYIVNAEFKDGVLEITYNDGTTETVENVECDCSEEEKTQLVFYMMSDGTYGVACGDRANVTEIVIPETHEGRAVSTVVADGFSGCTALTKITLPSSVTVIGDRAFNGCSLLGSIEIGDGVYVIGANAFRGCTSLTVTASHPSAPDGWSKAWNPDGCTVIWADSREYTKNGFVCRETADGIEIIGYTGEETELEVPDSIDGISVISVGADVFKGNKDITSVILPSSITAVGEGAFSGCTSLERAYLDGVLVIPRECFLECASLKRVKIDSAVEIGYRAFKNSGIEYLDTGSVKTVGDEAFGGCESLSLIYISSSTEKIGMNAVKDCPKLVILCQPFVERDGWHTLWNPDRLELRLGREPMSCLRIESVSGGAVISSYNGDSSQVIIPSYLNGEKIIGIAQMAFDSDRFETVSIMADLDYIEKDAFYHCSTLKKITGVDRVKKIERGALSTCSALGFVLLGERNDVIQSGAFSTSTLVLSTSQSAGENWAEDSAAVRYGIKMHGDIAYTENETGITYVLLTSSTEKSIFVPASIDSKPVTVIGDRAFCLSDAESIELPLSIRSIESEAFDGCTELASITVNNGVELSTEIFSDCKSSYTVYFKDGANLIINTENTVAVDLSGELYYTGEEYQASEGNGATVTVYQNTTPVSSVEELEAAISDGVGIILNDDITVSTQLSAQWFISYNINLNGHTLTFDSSLNTAISGQRYGLNIDGKGTVVYEGTGTLFAMRGHSYMGDCSVLTIGKDVTVNAPNATLVSDNDGLGTVGYPYVHIFGKVEALNILAKTNTSGGALNPRVDIYEGASVKIKGDPFALASSKETVKVNISGGTIECLSEENAFFDAQAEFEITGGTFYFTLQSDIASLEALLEGTEYTLSTQETDGKAYYTVSSN